MNREAIVVGYHTRKPVIEIDPFELPEGAGGFVDPRDEVIMTAVEAVEKAEDMIPDNALKEITLLLVWSDSQAPVRFVCPSCEEICDLTDGVVDNLPRHMAVVCGSCIGGDL